MELTHHEGGAASLERDRLGWQASLGGLVMLAMATGALLPFALGALAPFILETFPWSRSQFGTLTTFAFATAVACSPVLGRASDRLRGRPLLACLFATSAISLGTVAVAGTYWGMVVGALVGGLSMSANNPVTNKLIAAYGAPSHRGLLTGVKQSGVQMGSLLSGALLPLLADSLGWRGALGLSVVVPALCLAAVFAVLPRHWPRGLEPEGPSNLARLSGQLRWLMIYAFGMGGGIATITTYLPLYAHETLGFDQRIAGLLLAAVGLTGIASRILAGHFANRLEDQTGILALLALCAIVAQGFVLAAEHTIPLLVWVGALLLGATAVAWNAVAMLFIVKGMSFEQAGQASALVSLAFYGGFVVSPIAFGLLVDAWGRYWLGWAFAIGHFALAAFVVLRRRGRADEVAGGLAVP